jgi:flagellar protein FlgJ
MHVAPINSTAGMMPAELNSANLQKMSGQEQAKAVAGQFEAILLRQFLQESVGSIMGGKEGGAASGVYGFLLTDVLANQLSAGGGLGLSNILQHQLAPRESLAAVTAGQEEQKQ